MLNFRRIELSDRSWIEPLLMQSGNRGSEYTFSNNYVYRKVYQIDVAQYENFYLVRSGHGEQISYLFPAGAGDVKPVIQELMADADTLGVPFRMHGLTTESAALLEVLYPGVFTIEAVRDNFDYLYERERLVTLAGKKLHSKRNFVNRFEAENAGRWLYEMITPNLIDACWRMNEEWCARYGCMDNESLVEEQCAVRNFVNNFEALGLRGGLLRLDGEVIAFTLGRPVNADTFVVHVEKAFSEIPGAYPMINRQFVTHACAGFQYINREDDVGDEGLRRAKLSYKPDLLLEKFVATRASDGV